MTEIPPKGTGRYPRKSKYEIPPEGKFFPCRTLKQKGYVRAGVSKWSAKTGIACTCRAIDGGVHVYRCNCTMAQRAVGDGCEVCNPKLAREIARENKDNP